MENNRKVIIIGAGIAGIGLALFLKKIGLKAALFEFRGPQESLGGGLNIAPNGMHVLAALGLASCDVILNLADTDAYWQQMGELIAPQGHVGLIVEPRGELRIGDPYKAKSVSIHWEFMFTRSRFATADMAEQQRILKRVASLVDAGALRSPHTQTLGAISLANLQQAHALVESGQTIGKLTLAGWD